MTAASIADAQLRTASPMCAPVQGDIPQKHFGDLPVEIQLTVFSLVCRDGSDCLESLIHLGRVCWQWKHLSDSAALITRISTDTVPDCQTSDEEPTRTTSATVRILAKRARGCLRVLDLSSPTEDIAPIAIKEVALFCPNITHLNLSGCSFLKSFQLVFMVRNLACLTHVNLSGLKCVNSIALEILARPGRLQELDVSCCAQLRSSASRGLGAILDKCLHLHTLCVGNTGAMDDELMAKVWYLPVLTCLDVAESDRVSTCGILGALLGPRSSHHALSIPKIDRVRTAAVPAHYYAVPIADADVVVRPHIESLNFASCGNAVTSCVLTALAWAAPNLTALNISDSPRLTDDVGLLHLTRSCTRLTSLQIDNCAGVFERMQTHPVGPPQRIPVVSRGVKLPSVHLTGNRHSHEPHDDTGKNEQNKDNDNDCTDGSNSNLNGKLCGRNSNNMKKRNHDEHRRQHPLSIPSSGVTFAWLTHLHAAACTPHLTNARVFALLDTCIALRVAVLDDNAPALCARLVVLWLLMRSGSISSGGEGLSLAAAPRLSLLSLRGCGTVDACAVDALVAARRPGRLVVGGSWRRSSFSRRGSGSSSGSGSSTSFSSPSWAMYDGGDELRNLNRYAKMNDSNDEDQDDDDYAEAEADGDADGDGDIGDESGSDEGLEVWTDPATAAAAAAEAGECMVM